MSQADKLHRDEQDKLLRPSAEVAPAAIHAPADPELEAQQRQAADRLAKVSLDHTAARGGETAAPYVSGRGAPPSATHAADAMTDFRQVNGDAAHAPAADHAAPTSAAPEPLRLVPTAPAATAQAAAAPAPAAAAPAHAEPAAPSYAPPAIAPTLGSGRGAAPSAEHRADAMRDFRAVNGEDHAPPAAPPPHAPTTIAAPAAYAPAAPTAIAAPAAPHLSGRGAPPSAEHRAEATNDVREVAGDHCEVPAASTHASPAAPAHDVHAPAAPAYAAPAAATPVTHAPATPAHAAPSAPAPAATTAPSAPAPAAYAAPSAPAPAAYAAPSAPAPAAPSHAAPLAPAPAAPSHAAPVAPAQLSPAPATAPAAPTHDAYAPAAPAITTPAAPPPPPTAPTHAPAPAVTAPAAPTHDAYAPAAPTVATPAAPAPTAAAATHAPAIALTAPAAPPPTHAPAPATPAHDAYTGAAAPHDVGAPAAPAPARPGQRLTKVAIENAEDAHGTAPAAAPAATPVAAPDHHTAPAAATSPAPAHAPEAPAYGAAPAPAATTIAPATGAPTHAPEHTPAAPPAPTAPHGDYGHADAHAPSATPHAAAPAADTAVGAHPAPAHVDAGGAYADPTHAPPAPIVDGSGQPHDYHPHTGATPAPTASPGAHPGNYATPAPAPQLPPAPQSASQEALNAFITKARADRDAQKAKVQAQQLAKCTQAGVDGNVIAQQVKQTNDRQLAAIRAKAEKDKAAAASRAAEQKQSGPVSIESLKEKLEATTTADKTKLQVEFEAKKSELAVRIATQKETLRTESGKQIANYKAQQAAKKAEADAAWTAQKTQMETTAKSLMEQMRQQVAADQTRLEKESKKLWEATNHRLEKIEKDTAANAQKILDEGDAKAGAAEATANTAAAAEHGQGDSSAQRIRAEAGSKAATVEDEGQKQSIIAEGNTRAQAAQAAATHKAEDLRIKGRLNAKAIKEAAVKQSNAVKDAGKKAHDDAEEAAKHQVEAIGKKINELLPLAQQKIKKTETDLIAKRDEGDKKLAAQFAATEATIAKLQADADAKIQKVDGDAEAKLQKDYDAAIVAIDKRAEVARKQLAAGSEKNLKALEQMVDATCKSIDKSVDDTTKQFDHTVLDAEKQAQAFVMAQLVKIKAEADKALHAIDQAYADYVAQMNAAVAATTRQIEETAKGKMLEVEVHTATLLNDIGDGTRLAAAKEQLSGYIKNKQALPAGYGETAAPEPAPAQAGEKGAAAAGEKAPAPGAANDNQPGAKKDRDTDTDAEKAAEEERKKHLDPNDLSEAGIKAKLDEALKKGQKQTAGAAMDTADKAVTHAYRNASAELTDVAAAKNGELEKLKTGDPTAVAEVNKVRADEKAGSDAAAAIGDAMKKTNWYGGSSPDKKAIMSALEGKTPEQIEAMRAALKARTPSIDLDDFITKNMSGAEQNEARIRMTGDPIAGDLAALSSASGHHVTGNEKIMQGLSGPVGWYQLATQGDQNIGADKARVDAILAKYPKGSPEFARFKEQYEAQTGRSLGELLHETGNDDTAKNLGIEVKKETRSEEDIKKQAQSDADKIAADPLNKGKVDIGKCGAAVGDLNEALNGFHLDSTRADNVAKALAGKSPEEMAYIRAAYKQKTGRDLDRDLEGRLSGAALAENKATLRGDKTNAAVAKILGSEEASWTPWTVDDKKMQDTLKELKDPAERRAVLEAYEKRTGRKLETVIAEKMTGNDRELATALAQGDELKARMVELDEATNGGWLNSMHAAIHERTGLNTEPMTRGLVNTLVSPGNNGNPDAKLTLPGGYVLESGSIHKVDSDKIFELLEATPNPADRERIKALYKEKTHRDMDADMATHLVGPSGDKSKLDAYTALQDGRMDDYAAARMDDAVSGLNDTKTFHAQLEGKSERERKLIIDAYNRRHPDQPDAFTHMLDDQFGADSMDKQKAQLLATSKDDPTTGAVKLPDEFVLKYAQDSVWNRAAKSIDSATAVFDKYPFLYSIPLVGGEVAEIKGGATFMRGWGVDNDAIKNVLKGKSKAEIDALKAKYPDLEKDLGYCLSGRDAFEVSLMLKDGEPKTDEEKIQRRLALYEFDRGESGTWAPGLGLSKISNGITDLISPSGKMMDDEAANMRRQLAQIQASGALPPEAQRQLELSLGNMDSSTTHMIESREAVTEAMATAVGAVVGAAVTVLTGGVGGAILAALATGASTVATKVVMLGQSYGRNEMGVDLAMTAVQMATAGLGGGISKLSEHFMVQVLNGAIGAAASNFVQTAITSKDAHDLLGLLAQASKSGLVGMLSGGANAAATAALANAMASLSAKAFGPNAPLTGVFAKGFVSGAGGSVAGMFAEAMVDPNTMSGHWDQVFAKMAQGAASAGFQNGLTEAAQQHHERTEQVLEHAKSAVEEVQKKNGANRNVQEEQAAFAKAMSEGFEGVVRAQEADAAAKKAATQDPELLQRQREEQPPAAHDEPKAAPDEAHGAAPKDEVVGGKSVDEIKQEMDAQAATKAAEEQRTAQDPATAAASADLHDAAAAHEAAVERETQKNLAELGPNPTEEQKQQARERARLKVVNDEIEAPLEKQPLIDHQAQREDIEREFANGQKGPEDLARAAAMHEEEVQAKLDELTAKQDEEIKAGKLSEDERLTEAQLREKARGAVVDEELTTGIPDKTLSEHAQGALQKGAEKLIETLAGPELVEVLKLLDKQLKSGQITHEQMGEAAIKIGKELAKRGADLVGKLRNHDPELTKAIKEAIDKTADAVKEGRPDLVYKLGEKLNGLLDRGSAIVEAVNPKKPGFMEGIPAAGEAVVTGDEGRARQREHQEAADQHLADELAKARANEENLRTLDTEASGKEADRLVSELDAAQTHREGLEEKQRRLARIDGEIAGYEGELERAQIVNDPRMIAEAQSMLDSARARRDHVAELPAELMVPNAEPAPASTRVRVADDAAGGPTGPRVPDVAPEAEAHAPASEPAQKLRVDPEHEAPLSEEDVLPASEESQRKQRQLEQPVSKKIESEFDFSSVGDAVGTEKATEAPKKPGWQEPLPEGELTPAQREQRAFSADELAHQSEVNERKQRILEENPGLDEKEATRRARNDVLSGIHDEAGGVVSATTTSVVEAIKSGNGEAALKALEGVTDLSQGREVIQELRRQNGGAPVAEILSHLPPEQAAAIKKQLEALRADPKQVEDVRRLMDVQAEAQAKLEAARGSGDQAAIEQAAGELKTARQAAIDAICDTYGIDDSQVAQRMPTDAMGYGLQRGSITPVTKGGAVAEAMSNGHVLVNEGGESLFNEAPGVPRSPGFIAAALGHETEVHIEQLRGDRFTTDTDLNKNRVGTAINEAEAYKYMVDQADRFGLTKEEVSWAQERYDQQLKVLAESDPAAHQRVLSGDFSVPGHVTADAPLEAWTNHGGEKEPIATTDGKKIESTTGAPAHDEAAAAAEPQKPRKTPQELAKEAQLRANEDRANGITPEQRAKFNEIDQLAALATTPADFEFIRDLEAKAGRPVSERFSHNDTEASLQALAKQTDGLGKHEDGTPVTPEQHAAAVAALKAKYSDTEVQQNAAAHDERVDARTKTVESEIAGKDKQVTDSIAAQAQTAETVNGRKEIRVDQAISVGMGGSGASGAHGDLPAGHDPTKARTDRIGIEDATRPELWSTLGHKAMGQEAAAISYGRDGVRTSDIAEHGTAMPAKASDLALQVAEQRNSSGVGTVGSQGAIGSLEFTKVITPEGKTILEVGVPTKIQTGVDAEGKPIIETVLIKTTQGVDISTGMGPSRELLTETKGERRAQITPDDAAKLKESRTFKEGDVTKDKGAQMMSGDAALALDASAFKGERVLGIGGGPTSEWAMEHAVKGGAASVEVAGAMPRPKSGRLATELTAVETEIRGHVERNEPVPPELTKRHHEIVTEHVDAQRARLQELDSTLADTTVHGRAREKAQQERARIAAEIDPFLGSRVDRNHQTLNSDAITHVQADVIKVKPVTEEGGRIVIEVTYADGTVRTVDRVIPSIGADPDAPGGIHEILKNAPPDMRMIPVINEGRVVGLESDPPGISVSGAAMVGTLGTNMPPELMKRIPPEMRDAVVASVIDHANREGVSAGSKGIIPGIENVGANTELTIEAIKKIPPEQRSKDLDAFLMKHDLRRQAEFGGELRFPELQPKSGTTQGRVTKLDEIETRMRSTDSDVRSKAEIEYAKLKSDPEWQDAFKLKEDLFRTAKANQEGGGKDERLLSDNIGTVLDQQDQARVGKDAALQAKRETFERAIALEILKEGPVRQAVDAELEKMCAKAIDYIQRTRVGEEQQQAAFASLGTDAKKGYGGGVGKDPAVIMAILAQGNIRERMLALGEFTQMLGKDALSPEGLARLKRMMTEQSDGYSAADATKLVERTEQYKKEQLDASKRDTKGLFNPNADERAEGGRHHEFAEAKKQDMDTKLPALVADKVAKFLGQTEAVPGMAQKGESSPLARTQKTVREAIAEGLALSDREIQAAGGLDAPLNWVVGLRANMVNPNAQFIADAKEASLPLKAGVSGTTYRWMQTVDMLGGNPELGRLAAIASLQAADAHSFHEIAFAAQGFGVTYDPAHPYANVGLPPERLREIAEAQGTTLDVLQGGLPAGTQVAQAEAKKAP